MHSNAFLNIGEIKLVDCPQLKASEVLLNEGSRGGIKTIKYGKNVDESLINLIKGESAAKVMKLKKQNRAYSCFLTHRIHVETPIKNLV